RRILEAYDLLLRFDQDLHVGRRQVGGVRAIALRLEPIQEAGERLVRGERLGPSVGGRRVDTRIWGRGVVAGLYRKRGAIADAMKDRVHPASAGVRAAHATLDRGGLVFFDDGGIRSEGVHAVRRHRAGRTGRQARRLEAGVLEPSVARAGVADRGGPV